VIEGGVARRKNDYTQKGYYILFMNSVRVQLDGGSIVARDREILQGDHHDTEERNFKRIREFGFRSALGQMHSGLTSVERFSKRSRSSES
jgi:hypothetical protein